MNILITAVSSSTGPSGICRHAYSLACCAASRKEISQVTLVVGKWQESYFKHSFQMEDMKLSVVVVDIHNDAFARNLWYLCELPRLANAVAADIIHLSFPVPIRRATLNRPVVVSLHDLYPYDEPDNFGFPKVYFNRVFLQQCLGEVDLVTCVSETTLSRLNTRFPAVAKKKGVVVYNCVNIKSSRHSYSVITDRPFFLMVAQHRANKNITMALRVFGELLKRERIDRRTLLLLLGNHGPETTTIKSVIEREALGDSVKLIDGVSDEELIWLYKSCDILLAPSFMEGFGLPIVEGLLCGSRVVCSDIPTFREVGGEACYYFDLYSDKGSSGLATAICDALTKPKRKAEDLERFSLEEIARNLMTVYFGLQENSIEETNRGETVALHPAGS
ncbi:glycosyltransferase family 4 protein [Tunturiibacter gelidoferens]|uniref:glycosyltransferase family 4 protein n=1 Tax=Tunturiibacter gelidiferens TaxID=3069689 RepID=UPI0015CD6E6A|nr:glycosyltransferase family 1 protein [Edaphobacter lichenicola]